jgi:LysR family transcriptional regulator, transcriptional activator of nhaA
MRENLTMGRTMDGINYNHLYYFWMVAREGSIARASERLMLAPPTISAQIKALERSLGEPLFARRGRHLGLTEAGRTAFRYADEIFTAGREMIDVLRGRPTGRPLRLAIGVADSVPKLVAYRLIRPALELPQPIQIACHEGRPERLLAELALHELDVVLSDAPIGPDRKVRAFCHQLGECGVTIFGTAELARAYRAGFPLSLDGAPMLLPTGVTALRRSLDLWFDSLGVHPAIRAELDDGALMKVFGQSGEGLFPTPTVIEEEVRQQYKVRVVGRIDSVRERFYAISIERKLKNPAVVAICEAARQKLFS